MIKHEYAKWAVMKIVIYLIALTIMIHPMETLSQISSGLILPGEIDGHVKLQIPATFNQSAEGALSDLLSVYVQNERDDYSRNPVQGKYEVEKDSLIFTPYFPFEAGLKYVARVKNSDAAYSYQPFQIGSQQVYESASVMGIYPLTDQLPENTLRFYLYFNTPMKKGEALTHIRLVDENGNIDNQAFMEFKQELWSADGKRLTILFDPGRIKRGVSTNLDLGPALMEGNRYSLLISGNWKDVHGQEIAIDFTKSFEVVKAYRDPIRIEDLAIQQPKANTLESLVVPFDRVMDHALIQSMLRIEYENGGLVAGKWEISQDETKAFFVPEASWTKGSYRIIMNTRLEDVSGNNLNNLLDQKLNSESEIDPEELERMISI